MISLKVKLGIDNMNKEKKSFSVNYEKIVRTDSSQKFTITGSKLVVAKDYNEAALVCKNEVEKETKNPKDLVNITIDEIEERGVLPL